MSSILKYFQKKTVSHPATTLQLPPTNRTGLSSEEQSNVGLEINNASSINNKRKRVTYREEDKLKIAKYANECGTTNAVSRYKKEFPKLAESTIRGWLVKYRSQLKNTPQSALEHVTIGAKRGRPLLLSDDLDFKLRSFLTNLRTAGGTINRHVLYGVLMGLIKSDLSRYGQYLEFCVTNGWVQSLYTRMGYTCRMVTTSRPVITRTLWLETRDRFLNEIAEAVATYNIPDQLIINVDQTPSKFVPTENVTMAEKGETINGVWLSLSQKHWMELPYHSNWFIKAKQLDLCQQQTFQKDFVYHIMKNTGVMRRKPCGWLMKLFIPTCSEPRQGSVSPRTQKRFWSGMRLKLSYQRLSRSVWKSWISSASMSLKTWHTFSSHLIFQPMAQLKRWKNVLSTNTSHLASQKKCCVTLART